MTVGTWLCVVLLGVYGLAACSAVESIVPGDPNAPDPANWRLASGRTPSAAEFAAFVATCRDRREAFDECLAELGLKRAR